MSTLEDFLKIIQGIFFWMIFNFISILSEIVITYLLKIISYRYVFKATQYTHGNYVILINWFLLKNYIVITYISWDILILIGH